VDAQAKMSAKPEPKWKRFEKLAYSIQQGLTPNGAITLNDSIAGVDSGTARQIDISIREQIGPYGILVVIDCKDHKEPVDVKEIEAFALMVRDVRANKGAMISSNGFTKAALNVARNHGIDALRLVDTESADWGSYVRVNALLERTYIRHCEISYYGTGPVVLPASGEELANLPLYSGDGEVVGTAGHIVHSQWDRHEIPTEAGIYDVEVRKGVSVQYGGVRSLLDISASVTVGKAYYLGPLPIHVKGFHDDQNGALITRRIRTGEIDALAIQHGEVPGWIEIEDPSKLSVKVLVRLSYSNCYTDEDPDADREPL
jgi:hypothetical protein